MKDVTVLFCTHTYPQVINNMCNSAKENLIIISLFMQKIPQNVYKYA